MTTLMPYNREKAVRYASRWALSRNPAYYDFENLGGDCTNFSSQSVYAGAGVMNFKPVFGWYYRNVNDRTPSWTGVEYFYNFMVNNQGPGPVMQEVPLSALLPGDVVQLKFEGMNRFSHCPFVLRVGSPARPGNILIAAHTYDSYMRPLATYQYVALRPLHVLGVRP